VQSEVNFDLRLYIDPFIVGVVRFVAPLLNGSHSCGNQLERARNRTQFLQLAIFADTACKIQSRLIMDAT